MRSVYFFIKSPSKYGSFDISREKTTAEPPGARGQYQDEASSRAAAAAVNVFLNVVGAIANRTAVSLRYVRKEIAENDWRIIVLGASRFRARSGCYRQTRAHTLETYSIRPFRLD